MTGGCISRTAQGIWEWLNPRHATIQLLVKAARRGRGQNNKHRDVPELVHQRVGVAKKTNIAMYALIHACNLRSDSQLVTEGKFRRLGR